jgi:1-acyl-sn-glycerol-3-phosphate acyltransferase
MWALAVCAVAAGIILINWRRSGQSLTHFLGLGLVHAYARLWHGLSIRSSLGLPKSGPALVISNHTCSADPSFIQACCPRPLSFLIAREYYVKVAWARGLFEYLRSVPVARTGRDVAAARISLRRLAEGCILCIFPEGGLSGAGRGRVRPGKGGAALLALRSRAPVFPAFIAGGHQHGNVPRAWLLPSRVRIVLGPPVDLSAYYGRRIDRKLLEEVTAVLMNRIAALEPSPGVSLRYAGVRKLERKLP